MKKRIAKVVHYQGKAQYASLGPSRVEASEPLTSYEQYVEVSALTERDQIKLQRAKLILEERESFWQKIKNLWLRFTL